MAEEETCPSVWGGLLRFSWVLYCLAGMANVSMWRLFSCGWWFFVLDISWTVEKSISVLSGFYLYLILKTCHYLYRYAILGYQGWSITHFYHPNQLLERWELRKFCFILELICLVTCSMCFICLLCIWHNYSQLVSRNGWLLKFSATSLQMRSELLLIQDKCFSWILIVMFYLICVINICL
jgi:hypothetical protein